MVPHCLKKITSLKLLSFSDMLHYLKWKKQQIASWLETEWNPHARLQKMIEHIPPGDHISFSLHLYM